MNLFFPNLKIQLLIGLSFFLLNCEQHDYRSELFLASKNGVNEIGLMLNDRGELEFEVSHNNGNILEKSPLGLVCNNQDFSKGLEIVEVSDVKEQRESYTLKVGHVKKVDQLFTSKSVTFKNPNGALMILDLIAGNEGIAFRYRLPKLEDSICVVEKEITGFQINKEAKAWLQPYNKAGDYTPAYEDFYFKMSAGDSITDSRNPSEGFCMPALFNVNNEKNWILIAESGTDGSYSGCHLELKSNEGLYNIAFAKKDEMFNLPLDGNKFKPESHYPYVLPWRVVIIGDKAGDILLSTLITDLAPGSKIEDTSWISPGKASWSWWSHPDDKSAQTYNDFTDLAVDFGWEYTLFDAGWEKANQSGAIIEKAISKGVKPLVWGWAGSFFDAQKRRERFKELSGMGISGVKIDFWCSDRQEVMKTIHGVFEDAANEKLLVNLHGITMPRGWHRTWPNFVTAEAVLGTESYFYDDRFPSKAAEQNTVLPFTRNVAGPTDYTPVALTSRRFPRLNSAVHELATSMIYTSGIIHFADSKETFESLPNDIKNLLIELPATWDKTECLIGNPGKAIVLLRKKDSLTYIVGINGTTDNLPIKLDLKEYTNTFTNIRLICEGEDPLIDFQSNIIPIEPEWNYTLRPRGGFILQFIK
ncbi:glycoside hydrolase family 97 protein [Flavivirga sp. 57AJ16]|uniref:glycoside hydrolase family 97 protein n=1 Tax=Flavivirga sp. 57AJ16 TaxID=3025307 RepID=UPI0023662966|nr:glycoside hydrolase family 97 protein [Flavivirga sp. 57AJ16]MDD7885370.1 glycoside hydrolase family 97 catalytic domain-containing protein [Flavivirga sp. 57AJ16]